MRPAYKAAGTRMHSPRPRLSQPCCAGLIRPPTQTPTAGAMALVSAREATMDEFGKAPITVIGSIVFLAIVAVIVSKNAQTPQVLQAGFGGLSDLIARAVQP